MKKTLRRKKTIMSMKEKMCLFNHYVTNIMGVINRNPNFC